jgi:hypothetical protein
MSLPRVPGDQEKDVNKIIKESITKITRDAAAAATVAGKANTMVRSAVGERVPPSFSALVGLLFFISFFI